MESNNKSFELENKKQDKEKREKAIKIKIADMEFQQLEYK